MVCGTVAPLSSPSHTHWKISSLKKKEERRGSQVNGCGVEGKERKKERKEGKKKGKRRKNPTCNSRRERTPAITATRARSGGSRGCASSSSSWKEEKKKKSPSEPLCFCGEGKENNRQKNNDGKKTHDEWKDCARSSGAMTPTEKAMACVG